MLHVWNIYQHFPQTSPSHVGKYTSLIPAPWFADGNFSPPFTTWDTLPGGCGCCVQTPPSTACATAGEEPLKTCRDRHRKPYFDYPNIRATVHLGNPLFLA